jgi:hypothetical protein
MGFLMKIKRSDNPLLISNKTQTVNGKSDGIITFPQSNIPFITPFFTSV